MLDSLLMSSFGVKKMISKWVNWLETYIRRSILARREQLNQLKPGAVAGFYQTKLICVKMIRRPRISRNDPQFQILSLRNKMNLAIEEVVQARINNHYMLITSLEPYRHFNVNGRINQYGMLQFWKELDYQMKMFYRKKIKLTSEDDPNPLSQTSQNSSEDRNHPTSSRSDK